MQVRRRPNARQHQQLQGAQRTGAQHDVTVRMSQVNFALLNIAHPNCTFAVKLYVGDMRAGYGGQAGMMTILLQEGDPGAHSPVVLTVIQV